MADIFDFPQGVRDVAYDDDKGPCIDDDARHSTLFRPHGVPDRVWDAVLSVERMPRLQGMAYHEIPVPNSMANFGIGVELECDDGCPSGWIMVLYSLKFQEDWHSHWRCVAFASLPMPEKESKRMEPGMYWESMMRFLDPDDSEHVSGTVTVVLPAFLCGQKSSVEITFSVVSFPSASSTLFPSASRTGLSVL